AASKGAALMSFGHVAGGQALFAFQRSGAVRRWSVAGARRCGFTRRLLVFARRALVLVGSTLVLAHLGPSGFGRRLAVGLFLFLRAGGLAGRFQFFRALIGAFDLVDDAALEMLFQITLDARHQIPFGRRDQRDRQAR